MTIREKFQNSKFSDRQSRNAATALIAISLVSLIPANFPQSHELRYFMFWMITLVSFNLVVVSSLSEKAEKWLQVKYVGLVYLLFVAIVWIKIPNFYLQPDFRTVERFLKNNLKQGLVEQMLPEKRNCLIARHAIVKPGAVPFATIHTAFFYSSYFHPEVGYDYSIKAAIAPEGCGNLPVIPPNAQEFIDP